MKKYSIGWTDATMTEDFPKSFFDALENGETGEKENNLVAKKCYGSKVKVEITGDGGDWVDFDAWHEFEAKGDQEAIEYTEKYVNKEYRIECFSLMDKKDNVIFTEEDIKDQENQCSICGDDIEDCTTWQRAGKTESVCTDCYEKL